MSKNQNRPEPPAREEPKAEPLPSGGGSFVLQPDGSWKKVAGTEPLPQPHERKGR